jgi:hypothetical protein
VESLILPEVFSASEAVTLMTDDIENGHRVAD